MKGIKICPLKGTGDSDPCIEEKCAWYHRADIASRTLDFRGTCAVFEIVNVSGGTWEVADGMGRIAEDLEGEKDDNIPERTAAALERIACHLEWISSFLETGLLGRKDP